MRFLFIYYPPVFNKVFTEWSHELKIDLPCPSSNVSGDIDDENYATIDKLKLGKCCNFYHLENY